MAAILSRPQCLKPNPPQNVRWSSTLHRHSINGYGVGYAGFLPLSSHSKDFNNLCHLSIVNCRRTSKACVNYNMGQTPPSILPTNRQREVFRRKLGNWRDWIGSVRWKDMHGIFHKVIRTWPPLYFGLGHRWNVYLIIKSELRIINRCLGLRQETMARAECITVFSFFQITACRLFGTKPLSEPTLTYP